MRHLSPSHYGWALRSGGGGPSGAAALTPDGCPVWPSELEIRAYVISSLFLAGRSASYGALHFRPCGRTSTSNIASKSIDYGGAGEGNTSPRLCQGKASLKAANLLLKVRNFATIKCSNGRYCGCGVRAARLRLGPSWPAVQCVLYPRVAK